MSSIHVVAAALAALVAYKIQDDPSSLLNTMESFPPYLAASVIIFTVFSSWAVSFYFKRILGYNEARHKTYENGVSVLFALRLLAMGPGFQSLMKITSDTTRRRIYSGMRRFVFFGREIWTAGHPALCKHIFQPSNGKLWRKVDKPTLNRILFQVDVPNNAMLYTGDDAGWKHARTAWSPFFMETDFSKYDAVVDDIVSRHLARLLK